MKAMYIVVLDTPPVPNLYRSTYFPHGFRYKKDAEACVAEVVASQGQAHLVPKSQFTTELIRQVQDK